MQIRRPEIYRGYWKGPIQKAAIVFKNWLDNPDRTIHERSRIVAFLKTIPDRFLHEFRRECLKQGCFRFEVYLLIKEVLKQKRGRYYRHSL